MPLFADDLMGGCLSWAPLVKLHFKVLLPECPTGSWVGSVGQRPNLSPRWAVMGALFPGQRVSLCLGTPPSMGTIQWPQEPMCHRKKTAVLMWIAACLLQKVRSGADAKNKVCRADCMQNWQHWEAKSWSCSVGQSPSTLTLLGVGTFPPCGSCTQGRAALCLGTARYLLSPADKEPEALGYINMKADLCIQLIQCSHLHRAACLSTAAAGPAPLGYGAAGSPPSLPSQCSSDRNGCTHLWQTRTNDWYCSKSHWQHRNRHEWNPVTTIYWPGNRSKIITDGMTANCCNP